MGRTICKKMCGKVKDHLEWRINRYKYEHLIKNKEGENASYFLLRFIKPDYGLFAAANRVLLVYEKIIECGYIPLIDIEFEYEFKKGKYGEFNDWDLVFEQNADMKYVIGNENVLIGDLSSGIYIGCDNKLVYELNGSYKDVFLHLRNDYKEYYSKLAPIVKKAWRFKKGFVEEFEKEYGHIWDDDRKVIGIFMREPFSEDICEVEMTEENKGVYSKHPKTIGTNKIIEKAKMYLEEWKYDTIFVATNYMSTIELYKNAFGKALNYVKRDRQKSLQDAFDNTKVFDLSSLKEKRDSVYGKNNEFYDNIEKTTLTYAYEIYALSKCNALIAGPSSGAIAAMAINGGQYEHFYLLEDINQVERY